VPAEGWAFADAVNQKAFQREMKAAMPEMVANIEKCFRDAKTKLAGSAPDDVIREEVTRQVRTRKTAVFAASPRRHRARSQPRATAIELAHSVHRPSGRSVSWQH
jgi:hypothetical protein